MADPSRRDMRWPVVQEPIREEDLGGLTPLERLLLRYAREYLPTLRYRYGRFEQLNELEGRPESCQHVYAGTSYGDGVICTPCANESTPEQDAVRIARAQINTDRRDLAEALLDIARTNNAELLTPHELQLLGSLASELEVDRA